MPAAPRHALRLLLLSTAFLVLGTAAICGGSDGERSQDDDTGPGTLTTPTRVVSPIASPQPTQPVPTPSGNTPRPGGDYACNGSGPGNRITVSAPAPGSTVRSPVTVRGTASVFEATLQVVIRDRTGAHIGGQTVTASEGAPGTGTYEAAIPYALSGGAQPGCIEVFSRSARDGSIENLVSIRVNLTP